MSHIVGLLLTKLWSNVQFLISYLASM